MKSAGSTATAVAGAGVASALIPKDEASSKSDAANRGRAFMGDAEWVINGQPARVGTSPCLRFTPKTGRRKHMSHHKQERRGLSLLGRSDTPFPESPER